MYDDFRRPVKTGKSVRENALIVLPVATFNRTLFECLFKRRFLVKLQAQRIHRPVKKGRSPGESPSGRSDAFHYTFRCVMFPSKAMLVAPLRPVDADESPYRSANVFEFA